MDNNTVENKTTITPAIKVSVAMLHRAKAWFDGEGKDKAQEASTVLSSIHAIGEMVSTVQRLKLDSNTIRFLNHNFNAAYFLNTERGRKEIDKYREAHSKGEEVTEPITLTDLTTIQSFLMQPVAIEGADAFVNDVKTGMHYLSVLSLEPTIAKTQQLSDLSVAGDYFVREAEVFQKTIKDWTGVNHLFHSKVDVASFIQEDWVGTGMRIAEVLAKFLPLQEAFSSDRFTAVKKTVDEAVILIGTAIAGVVKDEPIAVGGRDFEYAEDKVMIAEYVSKLANYVHDYTKLYEFAVTCIVDLQKLVYQYLSDFAKGVGILMTESFAEPHMDSLKRVHKALLDAAKACNQLVYPEVATEAFGEEEMDIGYGGPSLGVVDAVPFPEEQVEFGPALEGILSGLWEMIAKIFDKIGKMIDKFITWLKSVAGMNSSNASFYTPETGKKIHEIISDSELKHAIEDGLKEASKATTLGNEDFFSAPIEQTMEIFAGFQKSLTEKEVDFLTSGHRYKLIEKAVNDYTRARLPEYVMGIEYDLFTWGQEGLNKSLHTGNGDVAVENFVKEQKAKLAEIERKYEHSTKFIRSMADEFAAIANANAARDRLNVFLKAPSGLYPHLDHLWKVIHFDRISEEDSKLINTLEDIHKKHETMLQRFRAQAKENDKFWPAEDEMLKMIMAAHKESSTNLSKVVRVAGFIKESALTAFNATMKSFSYLIRILGVVSKMNGVDQVKVKRSVDIISQRRRDLNSLLKIV